MDLQPYLTALAEDLDRATSLADDATREVVHRIAPAVEPAVRLAIVQALSDAAAAITSQLEESVVTLRMEGRDPVLEVRPLGTGADGHPPPAPGDHGPHPEDLDDRDSTLSRVSLRLPDQLKLAAEQHAAGAGQSLNTWVVQAVRTATRAAGPDGPGRRSTTHHRSRRVTGWA
ncbi:toxin-antitoxin system HicB family antitoxin [uncultured Serinicoccus sp.]|uniref:toxin-antitoxin system HicB family antitoxin n=1 Tax=uncultured Serinicoccus sp. TaxID=735514 RepID=UPI002637FFB1|nr:toxin-antitoxin system HicB family antitoxin [uncultured Serinicoccus sp.]